MNRAGIQIVVLIAFGVLTSSMYLHATSVILEPEQPDTIPVPGVLTTSIAVQPASVPALAAYQQQDTQTTMLWRLGIITASDSRLLLQQNAGDHLYFGTSNSIQMTVDHQGLVGIGRHPVAHMLEVNGAASKSTPGNWMGNSDARLKSSIQVLDPRESLQKLLSLRGVSYEWNDTITAIARPTGIQFGFTAQNIRQVFPTLVEQGADGYLSTAYGTLDPMMVEGLRAIHEEIESLKAVSQELADRLEKLERTMKN